MTAASLRPPARTLLVLSFVILHSLAALAGSSSLSGRVVDPNSRPVAGAEVIVSGPTAAPLRTRTSADGRFEVATLEVGRYTVVVTAPGLVGDAQSIDVATTPVQLNVTLRLSALNETLVVSASQVDQPLSRTPDSVTVIDGSEIDAKQQFMLSTALRSVPGLTIQQTGGPGTVTSLFTRGGESDYTLVMIDGVRANAFGGGLDLSQVPLDDVERIEVVRGPQSAVYGSDAIGGVVQVITRSGGAPAARAQIETGSRNLLRTAASTTGEYRGVGWQAGATRAQDDGYTGTAASGQRVSNDDALERQIGGSLGWRNSWSGTDLQGSLMYVDSDRGSPGPYGSDPALRYSGVDTIARNTTTRVGGGVRWVQPWFGASSRIRQRVEFDRADYDLGFVSRFGPSTSSTTRSHARVQTDVAASSAIGFSGGAEWLGERGTSTYITSGVAGEETPVKRSVLGLFAEGRWTANDRVTVTAGVRGERIVRDALAGDPLAFQPRPDFPGETITSVNPKLGASVLVAGAPATARAWTRVRGSVGSGIRPPDAFEIAITDNSGLKPERSKSGEIGVTQALASGAIQLDATAFINNYSDLIIAVGRSFSGVSRWRTDNISNARARGAEVSAAWRVVHVSLRGSYTFLDSEILAVNGSTVAQAPYAVGDPLLRRPRHAGTLDATMTQGMFSGFAQLQVRGETLDAEPAFGPTGGLYTNPGYTVFNIGGSWRIVRKVEIFARAVNLFDRRYEEVFGYPAPGRTGYVGARVAVGR